MVIDYENGNGPEIIYNFYGYQNHLIPLILVCLNLDK